jgi:hypothetical protein
MTLAPTADGSWRTIGLEAGWLTSVECPSVSLCVVVDRDGQAFASNDPAGGRSAWVKGPEASAPRPAPRSAWPAPATPCA